MKTIYFVRHGEAAAGFGDHRDPALSPLGRQQAQATARYLQSLGPLPIYSSPLRRANETAQALAELWSASITTEPRIAEIPAPIDDLADRTVWLAEIMAGVWTDLPEDLLEWRQSLINAVLEVQSDCVMFSHFVAINLLVGAAKDETPMVLFRPDNASITRFKTDGSTLVVETLGEQAQTRIN